MNFDEISIPLLLHPTPHPSPPPSPPPPPHMSSRRARSCSSSGHPVWSPMSSICPSIFSMLVPILTAMLLLMCTIPIVEGTTVTGTWNPKDLVKVVARFGFLKADVHHKDKTDGYVFGNVTTLSNDPSVTNTSDNETSNSNRSSIKNNDTMNHKNESNETLVTQRGVMVLIDRGSFVKLLGGEDKEEKEGKPNRNRVPSSLTCDQIFSYLNDVAYEHRCAPSKTRDLYRFLPCPVGGVCDGMPEPLVKNMVSKSQVTYTVTDQRQPTFWYLVFVSCHLNASCGWEPSTNDTTLYQYNLQLVNGRPDKASSNLFTYHFSYEEQDMILYIVMICLYITLAVFQVYAVLKQRHRNLLVFLFSTSLVLHSMSFFFATIHKVVYAQNGQGFPSLSIVSDVLRILSLAFFILFVLIIAKGWPMTRTEITAKPLLIMVWLVYIILELILFIWIKRSLDIVKEVDEYHTLPGWFSLIFRVILMLWFLAELRQTMMLEQNGLRLRFYLHFGAGIMVWFVHLPIVAVIGLQISLMWRYKLILGFSSAANFLAFAIMMHFMWPTKMSYHFLTHPMDTDFSQEELEDYDQHESFGYYNNPNYTQPNGTDTSSTPNSGKGQSKSLKKKKRRKEGDLSIKAEVVIDGDDHMTQLDNHNEDEPQDKMQNQVKEVMEEEEEKEDVDQKPEVILVNDVTVIM